ncbi:uncharacterized protein LOC119292652 [Triticum dicoccoides]|uniref:uncharacterized protein LOC119292652 n=1 Tax=Triticum dicoccoides TaxID=85692 RepID=UPI00189009F9|nr:uncharacterized protein LOC119292652 [Triticum dicoccoides]
MATLIPRAPPPNPHRHSLLPRPPTLSPQLRLCLPVRCLRLASPAATIATVMAAVPPDDISQLNNRLYALVHHRCVSSAATSPMDPAHADAYLHMIHKQQHLGLRQLRRHTAEPEYERDVVINGEDKEEGAGRRKGMAAKSSLGHRVDPRELELGEYVVHKKVGIGKFVCISGEDGEDYMFIQYADAMAKLAVDQAARMLYRYNPYTSTSGMWELVSAVENMDHAYIFYIPHECPASHAPICQAMDIEGQLSKVKGKENIGLASNLHDVESQELLQPFGSENLRKRRSGKTPLVETEVRRSDRIKKDNAGYKRNSCSNSSCLPCNAAPPIISKSVVKNLTASFCKVAEGDLEDKLP